MASSALFEPFEILPTQERNGYWLLGAVILLVLCNLGLQRWAALGPMAVIPLALAPAVFQTVIVAKYFSLQFLAQVGWFFLSGILFVILRRAWKGEARLSHDWEREVFAVPLLFFFSLRLWAH